MKEHDFDGAIQHVVSYGINPAYEIKDANIGEIENTIRHALTLAKRMQDEGHVVVPREPTDAMLERGGELTLHAFMIGAEADEEQIYKAMIQAAQEGNDDA